jgi:hypothetical protein
LIEAEGYKFPPRDDHKRPSSSRPMPGLEPVAKKPNKKKHNSDEEPDEVAAFKAWQKAAMNRPMVLQPVDRARKNTIKLSLAQVDPTASFAERAVQFDNLEAIGKKRKWLFARCGARPIKFANSLVVLSI